FTVQDHNPAVNGLPGGFRPKPLTRLALLYFRLSAVLARIPSNFFSRCGPVRIGSGSVARYPARAIFVQLPSLTIILGKKRLIPPLIPFVLPIEVP
ncbi:MAG TPA: hypothetical protein VM842_03210, partial [Nitrospira sp.]|nr:hypothetical protein [Nitrospira sp.]